MLPPINSLGGLRAAPALRGAWRWPRSAGWRRCLCLLAFILCGAGMLPGRLMAAELPAAAAAVGPLAALFDGGPGAASALPAQPAVRASGVASQALALAQSLAQRFPEARRAAFQQAYLQSLTAYREFEKQQSWAAGDLSAALAVYVAGNYAMARDLDVSTEQLAALAQQLRQNPGTQAWLRGLEAPVLQHLYESLAMEGFFMAAQQDQYLKQKAAAAAPGPERVVLRALADANLGRLLPGRAQRLRLGDRGLSLEAAPTRAQADSSYR